jgi:hypothetical protein
MASFGYLSDFFQGIAYKRLSDVEVDGKKSNQHEFNGVADLKALWGAERKEIHGRFLFLGDDDAEREAAESMLTWYDSREAHPTRSEFRFYYQDNPVIMKALPGDLLVIAKRGEDEALVIIARRGSSDENRLMWLFRITEDSEKFSTAEIEGSTDREADYVVRYILEEMDIEVEPRDTNYLELVIGTFGEDFPSTRKFSDFARTTVTTAPVQDDPDATLMMWFEREELLFRTLERHIVEKRLDAGFSDVDDFVRYSLSVHNRRKSRVGHALENHLEHLFRQYKIPHSRGPVTENKSRPDFIFPGIKEYRSTEFPAARLRMLGVKSTCKDRWRQVLSEAGRIHKKHLFTLEAGISMNQLAEMNAHSLTLVLPRSIHSTISHGHGSHIIDLAEFLNVLSNSNNLALVSQNQ